MTKAGNKKATGIPKPTLGALCLERGSPSDRSAPTPFSQARRGIGRSAEGFSVVFPIPVVGFFTAVLTLLMAGFLPLMTGKFGA